MQQPPIYLDINNNKSIINALKAGEEYVFDAVYRYYFRRLCAFCSQYVSEQEEIEEIVQDTMMWLWENRCSLMEELTLKTLLFTIVKNKALNRISHFEIRRKVHQGGINLPGGNGVRVDTAIYAGYTVPANYDSMIAKIIVHGQTRGEAISKMKRALEELVVEGIDTNRDFLYSIITHPDFIRGNFDTSFIEKMMEEKS